MPLLMGIVNVTPDSFFDGGLYSRQRRAIERGMKLFEEGAAIVDVGGESTRPGSVEVSGLEERGRVTPVVEALAGLGAEVSVDTSKLLVAEAAIGAGATMVNDITALRRDPEIATLCADRRIGLVLVHMQGTPARMQQSPRYVDVVAEVKSFLATRLEFALAAGVEEERIWLDPGIGFGKTLEHNLELLRGLDDLSDLGRPILVGTSRKSFIGEIDGSEPADRLGGTIGSSIAAASRGASALRVHDLRDVRQALETFGRIMTHP